MSNTNKFELGRTLITATAAARHTPHFVRLCLVRHHGGDWGDLDPEDTAANKAALRDGSRLLSSYTDPEQGKLWIITEWDRSVTTVLLPSDY